MKDALPVIAAGGTFAVAALVGLVAGIGLASLTANQAWTFGGLLAGLAIGAYAAVRLLFRST